MRDVKDTRSNPALVGRRQVRVSRPFNRKGSGDGRSKKLVDTRCGELRAGKGGNGIGCYDVGKRREGNRRRRVDAMTLTRARVTAIVGAHWGMFIGAHRMGTGRMGTGRVGAGRTGVGRVGTERMGAGRIGGVVSRMRRAINLRPGVGRLAHSARRLAYGPRRMRHVHTHRRRLSNLELQPDHQLKRQQNQQHGFRRADFGGWTTSHSSELTPRAPYTKSAVAQDGPPR